MRQTRFVLCRARPRRQQARRDLKIMLCMNAAGQAEQTRSKPCLFRHSCFREQQTEQSRVRCTFSCIYRVCRFTHNNDARGKPRANNFLSSSPLPRKAQSGGQAGSCRGSIFPYPRYCGSRRVPLRRATGEGAYYCRRCAIARGGVCDLARSPHQRRYAPSPAYFLL